MAWLFTRLTRADVVKLETLIESCLAESKAIRQQMKTDRARVTGVEKKLREAVHQIISAAPLQVTAMAEPDYEDEEEERAVNGLDLQEQRVRIPMGR